MKSVDIVITNASELVTLSGPTRPRRGPEMAAVSAIPGGAVAVDGGLIVAAGPSDTILKEYKPRKGDCTDASGKTVIPGLVDAHTHLVFAGSRENELVMKLQGKSYMEILMAGGGIQRTVLATRAASEAELLVSTLKRLDRMLLFGTTTAEGKSGYGLDRENEIRSLAVLQNATRKHPLEVVPTFLGAHAVPPEYKGRGGMYIDHLIKDVLPEVAVRKLARYCDVFCEEGVFSVEESRKLLLAAKKLGLLPKLHADEIIRTGGAELAAELGATSADHLLRSSRDGIKKMAAAGVVGVLLPGTPFTLMQKDYPDARGMIAAGLPLALATDLNPNCMTESLQLIIAISCYLMKMTPSEALTAATLNSAYAIGLGGELGSLEPGKRADIVILDAPNHIHLAYHFGVNLVETVIKGGKIVVKDGRLLRGQKKS